MLGCAIASTNRSLAHADALISGSQASDLSSSSTGAFGTAVRSMQASRRPTPPGGWTSLNITCSETGIRIVNSRLKAGQSYAFGNTNRPTKPQRESWTSIAVCGYVAPRPGNDNLQADHARCNSSQRYIPRISDKVGKWKVRAFSHRAFPGHNSRQARQCLAIPLPLGSPLQNRLLDRIVRCALDQRNDSAARCLGQHRDRSQPGT